VQVALTNEPEANRRAKGEVEKTKPLLRKRCRKISALHTPNPNISVSKSDLEMKEKECSLYNERMRDSQLMAQKSENYICENIIHISGKTKKKHVKRYYTSTNDDVIWSKISPALRSVKALQSRGWP